jgi:hypothetical protein
MSLHAHRYRGKVYIIGSRAEMFPLLVRAVRVTALLSEFWHSLAAGWSREFPRSHCVREELTFLAGSCGGLVFATFERFLCHAALLSCRHEIARLFYKGKETVCQFSHPIGLTSLNRFGRNQILSHPDRARSRQDKTTRRLLIDPSGRDQSYLR